MSKRAVSCLMTKLYSNMTDEEIAHVHLALEDLIEEIDHIPCSITLGVGFGEDDANLYAHMGD